jgi:hypothetical protein
MRRLEASLPLMAVIVLTSTGSPLARCKTSTARSPAYDRTGRGLGTAGVPSAPTDAQSWGTRTIGAVQNASHWRGCYGLRYNEDKQQILLSSAVFLVLAGRYRSKLARHSKYSDIDMRECSFPYNPSRWPDQLFRQIFKFQMRPDFGALERLRGRQIRFLPCPRVRLMRAITGLPDANRPTVGSASLCSTKHRSQMLFQQDLDLLFCVNSISKSEAGRLRLHSDNNGLLAIYAVSVLNNHQINVQ